MRAIFFIGILTLVTTTTLYSQKSKFKDYPTPFFQDTTILLINISDLDKNGTSKIIDYLSDKDPKVIGLHTVFNDSDGEDSLLIKALTRVKDKLVLNYYLEKMGQEEPKYLKGFDYGPDLIYMNKKNIVTSFGLNYKTELGLKIETFYMKVLKKFDTNYLYKENYEAYKIFYIGNKNCFFVVDYDNLDIVKPEAWKDKIVLIGYLGTNKNHIFNFVSDDIDAFFTPTSRYGVPKGMPNMYGIVITGNILSYLLNNANWK